MRGSRILAGAGAVLFGGLWFVCGGSLFTQPASAFGGTRSAVAAPPAAGAWVLTATNPGSTYAPTFTGNGVLGVRVPAAGQGYAGGTVPAQSELAGFYAQPPGDVQKRANTPTWSTLIYSDGGQPFSLSAGRTSDWRQSIDLRTGVVSTTARWTAPDGHVTDLSYAVLTDRARRFVGLVRLTLVPRWSGTARVTDAIDGTPAALTTQTGKGWASASRRDWVSVRTQGTNIDATLASQLGLSPNVSATVTPVDQTTDQSVGQQVDFPVTAGQAYTFTKFVGVESSQYAGNPTSAAQAQAADAAAVGFDRLVRETTRPGRRCGMIGSICLANPRWPRWSMRASSICGRTRARM